MPNHKRPRNPFRMGSREWFHYHTLGMRAQWNERREHRLLQRAMDYKRDAQAHASSRIAPMGGRVELMADRDDRDVVSDYYAKAEKSQNEAAKKRKRAEALRRVQQQLIGTRK